MAADEKARVIEARLVNASNTFNELDARAGAEELEQELCDVPDAAAVVSQAAAAGLASETPTPPPRTRQRRPQCTVARRDDDE